MPDVRFWPLGLQCLLLALSGHRLVRRTCLLMTQSGLSPLKFVVDFISLSRRFVQPGLRLDKVLFAFRPQLDFEGLSRQPLLVGGFRVPRNLRQRLVAGNRLHLVGAATAIRQPGCRRLAQAVKRAMGESRRIALGTEPITEACRRERPTPFGR